MLHWQNYNEIEKVQLLNIVSAEKKLPRLAIEKDWWVCVVLKALSMSQYSNLYSFKGGTSLSKGWKLIERFSEDIDIAIKRDDRFSINGASNSQLAKVRHITPPMFLFQNTHLGSSLDDILFRTELYLLLDY